jgi:hypothetical protein
MNKTILTILGVLTLAAMPAVAVPSGINYQAALTDDQGNPVTGTRTMSIKLYDAATGGTLLYSEDIGTVDVSDGVFSFEFGNGGNGGDGGTSYAEQSDTVALTDGTATTFQKVVSAAEVVAGSVSVTDGTYTWSQSGGSSNEDEFGVAYSTGLRRVTVNYYNGAPAAGRTITATYRSPTSGIAGALAGDNQPWAEITVDGVAQIPRQKVLTVPFAAIASRALSRDPTTASVVLPIERFGASVGSGDFNVTTSTNYIVPLDVTNLQKLVFSYALSSTAYASANSEYGVYFNFNVQSVNPSTGSTETVYTYDDKIIYPQVLTKTNSVTCGPFEIPRGSKFYKVSVSIRNRGSSNWGSVNSGTFLGATLDYLRD